MQLFTLHNNLSRLLIPFAQNVLFGQRAANNGQEPCMLRPDASSRTVLEEDHDIT